MPEENTEPEQGFATEPLVSVVIPARNAAGTLAEALISLREQQYRAWEAIVVDDGSIDDTEIIARIFSVRDGRIRCVPGPQRGVSAARNAGIARARGDFVAFLDADDRWMPSKLRTHMQYLSERPNVGLTFDRVLFVDNHGHSTGVLSTPKINALPAHAFIYENPACTASTMVVRRDALAQTGGFDEQMRCSEDLELLARMRCTTSWHIEGLNKVLTHYRASPRGASASLTAMQSGWEGLIDRVRTYAPEMVARHYRAARAVHLRYLARRALRLGIPAATGLRLLLRAAASSPVTLLRDPRRTFGTLGGLCAHGLFARFTPTR